MTIDIVSFIKSDDGSFERVEDAHEYHGDSDYVEGAISFVVDGVELFGLELWDDVNWLWPLLVHALDDYRRTGLGQRSFPDQPIYFKAEAMSWKGHTLLTVTDRGDLNRSAAVPTDDLLREVAKSGAGFFRELGRLVPVAVDAEGFVAPVEEAILSGWLGELE
ncbi:hypothetical protein ACFT5B_16055 [Luteimicrobium sp. NPDC057192]|uniref:hypothetical protein n=1 Tax=Luteimicrobium sp. NPDC057192 TaxID=3346042 RepID=UPI00362C0F66